MADMVLGLAQVVAAGLTVRVAWWWYHFVLRRVLN
jgi:hypothetical protein